MRQLTFRARAGSRAERGQASIFLAMSIPVWFGLMGLVVDFGWAYCRKVAAKTAATAAASAVAASAGATAPTAQASTTCPSTIDITKAWNVGCDFAIKNGFTNGSSNRTVAIAIGSGSTGIPVSGVTPTGYWVSATVSESIPTLFSRVIGDDAATVSGRSTVAVNSSCTFSSLTSPMGLGVLGLANTTITNSNVTINGNEGVYTGGSISNMAPSTVTGNVYEASAGQCSNSCGPGKVNGSLIVDSADLQTLVTAATSNASTASALTPTQTFSAISSPTTITGNGGTNVIRINGDINSSITLSGSAKDLFIINVSGSLSLSGSTSLGLSGGVTASHVLYNFTGTSGSIKAQVGNTLYGTFLAPNYSMSIDGIWYGELIGKGTISLLSAATVTSEPFSCSNIYKASIVE